MAGGFTVRAKSVLIKGEQLHRDPESVIFTKT